MQSVFSITKFLFLILLILTLSLSATAVPKLISYQGILRGSDGTKVQGSTSFTFKLYYEATGGNAAWSETQVLQVSDGVFNVQLGAVTHLPPEIFESDDLYISIAVGADVEMTPRQKLTSTAYSQRSLMPTPVPKRPGPVKVLHYAHQDNSNFIWTTIATVPAGKKWLITGMEVDHIGPYGTENNGTLLRLNGKTMLSIDTFENSAGLAYGSHEPGQTRQQFKHQFAPYLDEGKTIEIGYKGYHGSATVFYSEVDANYPTKNILMLAADNPSTTHLLGTVPSGKTWRILALSASIAQGYSPSDSTYTPIQFAVLLNDVKALSRGGYRNPLGGDFDAIVFDYAEAPVLTEGQTVKLWRNTTWSKRTMRGAAIVLEE